MSLKSQRHLAAEILKVGKNRVWIDPERMLDVEVAITREEVRRLIREGAIRCLATKGVSRARARISQQKRKKGLRRGPGRKTGSSRARVSKKQAWTMKIRALRRRLRGLKETRVITQSVYRRLYNMAGSGAFESTADLDRYIRIHNLGRKR